MSRLLAVVGTDTAVGKTMVTAAIAACAQASGTPVRVLKPVQTGFPPDDDAAAVDRLVGAPVARRGRSLEAALGPAVAARLQGTTIAPGEVEAFVSSNRLEQGLTLIEAAGGVAVEIAGGYDTAALVAVTRAEAVLVCRPSLGTLNHTVLSVRHLRAADAVVLGLVISAFPREPGLSDLTNPAELERLTGLRLLGVLPQLPALPPGEFAAAAMRALAPTLGGFFNRVDWLRSLEDLRAG